MKALTSILAILISYLFLISVDEVIGRCEMAVIWENASTPSNPLRGEIRRS